ncbi:MAG: Trp family transcriptional regulator [bacterium]
MAQTSKTYLDKQTENRIFRTFAEFFCSHLSSDTSGQILSEFLTPTEKTYLTKRFMIAYFLIKGVDHRTISDTLKVSLSTTGRVSTRLERGEQQLKKEVEKFFGKHGSHNKEASFLDILMSHPGTWHRKTQVKQHLLEHK